MQSAEDRRLHEANERSADWRRWGTYLPERQWGTVREDYSEDGNAWSAFTYDAARYRAYRWGEDGILGWTDRQCRLCFSFSFWNGQDSHLKERLFGLTNPEGNHGEDVKELFYYLDATPTHSYAKALYKYPQRAFPYQDLRDENRRRGFDKLEYELLDTGIFEEERYFDLQVEYAKVSPEDTLIRLTVSNRGPEAAPLVLLPTLTLRNNWSWHDVGESGRTRPSLVLEEENNVVARHQKLGEFVLTPIDTDGLEQVLFTENDSNLSLLDPDYNGSPVFSKDAFDRFIVHGQVDAVRKDRTGTKCGLLYRLQVQPGESRSVRFRLVRRNQAAIGPGPSASQADATIQMRADEANEFYKVRLPDEIAPEERRVARQAYAGLLWSKQFYYFVADKWLSGDHTQVRPSGGRGKEEEHWKNLFCRDVLSIPDKWEYPWFAAWDLAFHMLPMAELDPQFAKDQLLLLLREWYMHPSGQLPAYEFAFSDVNPPVHAWAVWHVYRMGVAEDGRGDLLFLERAFQKLMLNFTWWVNRNDAEGQNLFGGGFLGLDNIGVFDRSEELPNGACLNQADGTAWMGLFCAAMLQIALELAHQRSEAYEDIASKFFEHYIAIIDAMNAGSGLWDEEEGFYFDQIKVAGEPSRPLHIKSMVGLIPLFAVCILKRDTVANLSGFKQRLKWFMENKPELSRHVRVSKSENEEIKDSYWISIVPDDRLSRILTCVLDQERFFSPFGIRSLSREHFEKPFTVELNGKTLSARYTHAEGDTGLFGGNSNWRGPVWFPVNMLLINALERYYLVYGESFRVECPTHSGNWVSLVENAEYLSYRLTSLFLPNDEGWRPCHGTEDRYAHDPYWRDLVLFSEYFSGDDGRGIGASHQTGWTALVATLIRTRHLRRDARNRAQ